MNIKTLIFDLGGVIINLHEQATIEAFVGLSGYSVEKVVSNYESLSIFKDHEKGLISDDAFRQGIRDSMELSVTDDEIDHAWNSMLGEIPIARINHLIKLKEKYKVLILSNTNGIHEIRFNEILKSVSGKNSMKHFVHEVFLSHRINMRKPEPEIYQHVVAYSGIDPTTSLFLDDKLENLLGAESVGIQTMHISHPDNIFTID